MKSTKKYNNTELSDFLQGFERRNQAEPEFYQAVSEVATTVMPYIRKRPEFAKSLIMERMTEPDRIFIFRVTWEDDNGNFRVNRGYRVQFNNSIGPYKGGLRFHPSVNLSILKFLAFEQTFKNALTSLPLGSAKGGADFNPRGKSNGEILRFCKSYMLELYRYIGPNVDIPAGDIGVGGREIGYLFGQYKRITGEFSSGTITGKGLEFGGSLIRKEATGFGAVYFAQNMLSHNGNRSLEGRNCLVSGSGNVAQHCAEKIIGLGGKVMTISDSDGFLHFPKGMSTEQLEDIMQLKNVTRGRLSEYAKGKKSVKFYAGARPWSIPGHIAFPCATQNEIEVKDAKQLLKNNIEAVVEGANMPTTLDATNLLLKNRVLFGPAKAANAGGVAVSGLEMSQNSQRIFWSEEELDFKLKNIMLNIHHQCLEHAPVNKANYVDYLSGANIAGFIKVARAMMAHGV